MTATDDHQGDPDVCPLSRRPDGKHGWEFDGDDRLNVLVPGFRHRWAFRHDCDRGDRGRYVLAIDLSDAHVVNEEGTTVRPSILCVDCGLHGFLRDGVWRSC